MNTKDCPTEELLSLYAVGDLSDGEAHSIVAHLDQCTSCLNRLDTLVGHADSLVSALRRPVASPEPGNPALAKAIGAVLSGTIPPPAATPSADAMVGTVFSGYRIVEVLGVGGMGHVYRARHPRLEQDVALKILRHGFDSQQFVARFEAERQALALMDHPHIARVFDGGVSEQGQPYFAMELVGGQTITKYCEANKTTLARRLNLFIEVCQAVQHAHQKGIIHRDIKPSNVLVTEYDGQPVPKIIDFGIAKAIEGRGSAETEFGMVVGTLEYMSPEQAGLRSSDIDTRSDVYSLGVLLYELLTGDTPLPKHRVHSLPILDVLRLIREDEPVLPSVLLSKRKDQSSSGPSARSERTNFARQVRGELDWIVQKSLEKDRNQRYESASALADDVRRFLSDDVVFAGPRTNTYRLRKLVRRYKHVIATAAAFVLLLISGVVVSTVLAFQARDAQAKAETDRDQAAAAEKLAKAAEAQAKAAEAQAKAAEEQAKRSAAEAQSVLKFLQERILAVSRPEGQDGGLGRDLTIRQAVDAAVPHIAESFPDQPLVEATIRNTLGMTYTYVAEPAEAAKQFELAIELRTKNKGVDDATTLEAMNNLGVIYVQLGKVDEAQKLLGKVRQARAEKLGENNPETLQTLRAIADALNAAGRSDEAVRLAKQAEEGLSKSLGPLHTNTLLCKATLGSALRLAGRYQEAVDTFEFVHQKFEAELGEGHPYSLSALNNLGLSYRDMQDIDRAIPLFSKAAEIQKVRIGPKHLHTLTSVGNLALCHLDRGQPDQAIPLLLEIRDGYVSQLGTDHTLTIGNEEKIATAYQKKGRTEDALQTYTAMLEKKRRLFGENHPDTLHTTNNVAACHFFLGRVDQAIAIHQENFERRSKHQGATHPDTMTSLNNLAYCHWKAKHEDVAIDLFQKALDGRMSALGPEHPATTQQADTLIAVLKDVGRLEQALSLAKQLYDDRNSRFGSDHVTTKRFERDVAIVSGEIGKRSLDKGEFAKAEEALRPGYVYYTKISDSWTRFIYMSLLGAAMSGQKKFGEAEPLLVDGYEGLMKNESPVPANTKSRRSDALSRLIRHYDDSGNTEAAEKWRAVQENSAKELGQKNSSD